MKIAIICLMVVLFGGISAKKYEPNPHGFLPGEQGHQHGKPEELDVPLPQDVPPDDLGTQNKRDINEDHDLERRETTFINWWLGTDWELYEGSKEGVSGPLLEITRTSLSPENAHWTAFDIIGYMVEYMPTAVFTKLAGTGKVGIFMASEKIAIYPEYAHLADREECKPDKCKDECSSTCTSDGRKWDATAGAGGIRAVAIVENVMCTDADPYYKKYNVLAHEFGHTVHQYGLDTTWKNKIQAAYENAKAKAIWQANSYEISTVYEYFAGGSTVFFHLAKTISGGMHECSAGKVCETQKADRDNIKAKDPLLFEALSYVWTNNKPEQLSYITLCPDTGDTTTATTTTTTTTTTGDAEEGSG